MQHQIRIHSPIMTMLHGSLVLLLGLAGCGGGSSSGGGTTPPASTAQVRIEGVVDDGLANSPLANAPCQFVDLNGREQATTTANASGQYSLPVTVGLTGVVACHPVGLTTLQLTTLVSTVGQSAGAVLREAVTPTTTLVTDLVRQAKPSDLLAKKRDLLAALDARVPDMLLLARVTTTLFNAMLTGRLNSDLGAARTSLLNDGLGSRPDLQSIARQMQQELAAAVAQFGLAVPDAMAGVEILASEGGGDTAAGGGDAPAGGAADGGVGGTADDGAQGSPLPFAVCTYVTLDDRPILGANGLPLRTIANARGAYFLPAPVGTAGVVQCRPPATPLLRLDAFAPDRGRGQLLLRDVKPQTTVVRNILQAFRQALPTTDLGAVEDDRLGAIENESEPEIALVSDAAVALYVALFKGGINTDFQRSLDDLFRDGEVNDPALRAIAQQVNAQVDAAERRRGAKIEDACTEGEIRGVVVDAVTQRPLAGVTVTGRRQSDGVLIGRDTSDDQGRFRLRKIPTGASPFGVTRVLVSVPDARNTTLNVSVVSVARVNLTVPFTR